MNNIKVIHIPSFNDPYQRCLTKHLTEVGVESFLAGPIEFFSIFNITPLYQFLRNPRIRVLHLHWQHPFLIGRNRIQTIVKSVLFISQLLLLKAFGKKIVWTVHNLKSHENKQQDLEVFFARFVAKIANHLIAMCPLGKHIIAEAYRVNSAKITVIPHGNFVKFFPNTVERRQARKRLNLSVDKTVFVFLGLIRPYKGVLELMQSYEALQSNDAHLVVAGNANDSILRQSVENIASRHEDITLDLRYIPDDEICVYMQAADVFVCPYLDILNSGGVILGISYGKPIVAPRLGCIPDILEEKCNFLYEVKDESGLQRALSRAIAHKRDLIEMGAANLNRAENYAWPSIAEATAVLYRKRVSKKNS